MSDEPTLPAMHRGRPEVLAGADTERRRVRWVHTSENYDIGPLLDYDAAHGRELVHTLDMLLACGLSKAEAARRLHIRRQTLYQRLDTISDLLGGLDLSARERRTSLDLALVGWRLRTAGAGSRSR